MDTNTYGKSVGHSGSYSTNHQMTGRELMTPDEVRMLDNRYAILFIRGERPVMDLKFNLMKHPNVKYSADGKGGVYLHGAVTKAVATISLLFNKADGKAISPSEKPEEYVLWTEEEMEQWIKAEGVL